MSTVNNQNTKKCSSSNNSSMVNTPASTPVATMANGQTVTQGPLPLSNAPKYGTPVPNRIFVGGISANTTESELAQLFSQYGTVKAAKIIQDRAGVSKGYGFITFESEDDAKRLREADNIVLRERKLNIAPAIKKQPFSRPFDGSSPPTVAQGSPQYFFQPGAMPYFQGGVAYYAQPPTGPTDPTAQQQPVYQPQSVYTPQSAPPQTAAYPPVMFPAPPIYMPQQYPIHVPYDYNYYPNGGPAQYMVGTSQSGGHQIPPMQQQRPNSPPRQQQQPCYGGQLPPPYANPPPDVYYNIPFYGAVDGMYADPTGMDMSMPNGVLPEDSTCANGGDYLQESLGEISSANTTTSNNTFTQQTDHSNNDILPRPSSTHSVVVGSTKNVEQKPQQQSALDAPVRLSTPVVSVLTLDQHQEKDLMSMQSGRRKKPINSGVNSVNTPPVNMMPFYPPNYHVGPPNYTFIPPPPLCPPQQPPFGFPFGSSPARTNPYDNFFSKTNKWRPSNNNNERKSADNSSLSSHRTDSNSSASIVDESRNEDSAKQLHSAQSQQNKYFTRNFQNSKNPPHRGACSASNNSNLSHRPINSNINRNGFNSNSISGKTNHTFFVSNATKQLPPPPPALQMHSPAQHFIPPARRIRRTLRRNGSTSLSEIGAGDAPLPTSDSISDASNKLESLKL